MKRAMMIKPQMARSVSAALISASIWLPGLAWGQTPKQQRAEVKKAVEEAKEARDEAKEARDDAKDARLDVRKEAKEASQEMKEGLQDAKDAFKDWKKEVADEYREWRAKWPERRQTLRMQIREKWAGVIARTSARAELRTHARRMARLHRIQVLARAHDKPKVAQRAEKVRAKENARHDKKMAEIRAEKAEAQAPAPAPAPAPAGGVQ